MLVKGATGIRRINPITATGLVFGIFDCVKNTFIIFRFIWLYLNVAPKSVINISSKTYESMMNDQLFEYFLDKFHDFLCAFRRKYGCQSVLLKAVGYWKYAMGQNLLTGVVFMYLTKAFDCLPHGLHEPRIFYPSGHWPETVTNAHVSAHFR